MEKQIQTAAFTKTYSGTVALDFPAFVFQRGTVYAVIGPNGSGKTTMARVLAGITPADGKRERGRVLSSDVRIGYLPQKSFAFRLRMADNVRLAAESEERAAALLQELSLESLAGQSAKSLSGGETAKMALARVLARKCDLLILDEPTASMDMQSALTAERLIKTYCEECQAAVILISHSLAQVRRMADAVLFLWEGRLQESGETARVFSSPEREETSRFLAYLGAG